MAYNSTSQFLENLQKQRDASNKETQKRLDEALGYYDKMIQMFSPGGAYGKGLEKSLALGFKRARAASVQGLTSSGLASTQMMAGAGQDYEEQVANKARTSLEMDRFSKLAGAYEGKAGVLERVEDYGPSDELMMQAATYQPSGGGIGGAINTMQSNLDAFMERARGTSTPSAPKTSSGPSRTVNVAGHFSTGEGADSAYTKGFYIPTSYKWA